MEGLVALIDRYRLDALDFLDGSFVIAGLDPGPHILRVEPLDDGDIESFFESTLNIDIDFRPQFYDRIVVVPRGGGTSGIELKVVAR